MFTDEPEECEDIDPHPGRGLGHERRIGRGHHTCAPHAPPGQLKKDHDGDGVPDDADLDHLNLDLAGLLDDLRQLVESIPTSIPGGMHRGWKEHFQRRYNSILGRLTAILNRHGLHMRLLRRIFLENANFHRLLAKLLERRRINGPRFDEEEKRLALDVIAAAGQVDAEAGVRSIATESVILTPVRYDHAGAMVQKGELCYDYHPNGRLRRVGLIQQSDTPLVERRCDWREVAVLLEFDYDPWGRRIRKNTYGVDTWFAWDGQGRVIAEALPDGSWLREYFYLDGRPLAMWQAGEVSAGGCVPCSVTGIAGIKFLAGGVLVLLLPFGLIVFRRKRRVVAVLSTGALAVLLGALLTCDGDCGDVLQSNYYFYHNDHRGAPVFMTDRDARVVWTAVYRPYGEAYVDNNPDGDGTLVTNNLRYPGQYEDTIEDFPDGERLYYNVMRYYDPGLGRYITGERYIYEHEFPIRRSVFSAQSIIDLNTYRYAYNNPLLYYDVLGLQAIYGRDIPQPYQRCLVEIFGAGCIWRTQLIPHGAYRTHTY